MRLPPPVGPGDGVPVSGRDLRALPKAHLHVHLTGSIRASTFTELGGTTSFPSRYRSWDEFVATYRDAKSVMARA